jgi:hypothetical protein
MSGHSLRRGGGEGERFHSSVYARRRHRRFVATSISIITSVSRVRASELIVHAREPYFYGSP